jgi:hypothetical protein
MNHFERNCPKATALVAELGLLPVHYRDQAYWSGDIQLTYLKEKDGSDIGKNWAQHEEIALKKLNKIEKAREKQGTVSDRLETLFKELLTFLPKAKLETTGFWHLHPDVSGDEIVVLCGRGISHAPGVSAIWIHLWDKPKDDVQLHIGVDKYHLPSIPLGTTPQEIVDRLRELCKEKGWC